jgi:protein SCO1/2
MTGAQSLGWRHFHTMHRTIFRIVLFSTLGIVVAALFAWQYGLLSPDGRGQGSGVASIGGPFALVDQNGKTRTDKDFRGKLALVYFGYTYCPDVCPTALQVMSVALDMLGKDAEQVAPIFITVDPERDTVAHLRDYVKNFHPGLVGLTGSAEAIRQTAKAYRIFYRKADVGPDGKKAGDGDYLMDHSSIVLLMDREGRYLTHFTHQSKSEDIAAEIRKHL